MRHARAVDIVEMIEPDGPGSPRDRLSTGLRAAILGGRMRPGDAMPSSRAVASAIGVARGTVVRVYDELSGEGYLETVHGSGTFVSMRVPPRAAHAENESTERRVNADTAPPMSASSSPPIELRPGIPSTASITRGDWAAAWRRATGGEVAAVYPPAAGLPSLREQIARHLFHSRGLACDADDVIVTSGAREGLALVALGLAARLGGRLRVGCENPGHVGSRAVLARLGAELVPIDVIDGGIALDSVRSSRVSALLVTPSHQYPLGGSLDVGRRLQLLEWAERTNAIIIEDDYDSEFRHLGRALPSIASLDDSGLVVHVGSYSKVITPWLRCGYVVVRDKAVRAAILDARADVGETVSGIPQQALAHYLESGGLSRHLARTRRAYAHKRALVLDALGGELESCLVLSALDGGLHAVLSSPAGTGNADLAERLSRRGVAVTELARHYFGPTTAGREGIVFGYGAATDLELHTALATIRRETV
ncbi:MocR-like pyridoxine biosynthesis transcription factor PdxR [Agreia pratensis]|uniref:GntR family transcriptional regulator / MocR family aminotransferase n=1 Tax=Agreia pratensis TaxID=150121 RepID=A0A1X7L3F1_9MICO|nr:PLP-dependent aminotransferase family protein [Agreia pratensis]SMG48225.1 GntR family transcriptional regulator / MocR family aminotransferase [Agreia pratensis]